MISGFKCYRNKNYYISTFESLKKIHVRGYGNSGREEVVMSGEDEIFFFYQMIRRILL